MSSKFWVFLFLLYLLSMDCASLYAQTYDNCNCNVFHKLQKRIKDRTDYRRDERKKIDIKSAQLLKNSTSSELDDIEKLIEEDLPQYDYEILDPHMACNQKILRMNMFIFRNTLLPFIYLINAWVPKPLIDSFKNFTNNFLEVKNYIVYKSGGEHEKAKIAAERFFTNTFLGGGGFINVAQIKFGDTHAHKDESFDRALYKKGRSSGRYLMLPFLNQFYERRMGGDIISWLINPMFYFIFPYNYLYYFVYEASKLTDKREALFANRKYTDTVYNSLRDLETYEMNYNE